MFDFTQWLWVIAIGGLAGWLAGGMMRGGGYGIFGNVILGVIGGLVGRWLFGLLNIALFDRWGLIGEFLYALIGALIIMLIAGLFKRE